jgi:hypothetical protein
MKTLASQYVVLRLGSARRPGATIPRRTRGNAVVDVSSSSARPTAVARDKDDRVVTELIRNGARTGGTPRTSSPPGTP